MKVEVRPFQNTDTESLCRIFRAHHAAAGIHLEANELTFEACILAKPYFEASKLLVAVVESEPKGFLHIANPASEDLASLDLGRIGISAWCITPCQDEDQVAQELISAAQSLALRFGVERLSLARPPYCPFYVGVGPGGGLIGVPQSDHRQMKWLEAIGMEATDAITAWELHLAEFQPPVDRLQIQVRRMAHVDRQIDEPMLPWFQACMLGHSEQIGFQLTSRTHGKVTADVLLWAIGNDVLPDPQVTAHLWPLTLGEASLDESIFLLAEALRQMRDERFDRVVTALATEDTAMEAVLGRIGFRPIVSGSIYGYR